MKEGTASRTARGVAARRLEYDRVAAPYGDPAADEALTSDVADGLTPEHNRMHEYIRARTAFFDRIVVNSIDRGVAQVVIGGAGYDGRAFRYAKPGVRWFEVDHPATQADKLGRIARLGIATPQVSFIPADFTADPVAEPLLAAGLDPAPPGVVPVRRRRRLPGTARQRARPRRVPRGHAGRQPARDQRFRRWCDLACARRVPAAGRGDGRACPHGAHLRPGRRAPGGRPLEGQGPGRPAAVRGTAASGRRPRQIIPNGRGLLTARHRRVIGPRWPRLTVGCSRRTGRLPACRCRPCCRRRSSPSRSRPTTRPSTACRTAPRTTASRQPRRPAARGSRRC